jgi:hypothetical protein
MYTYKVLCNSAKIISVFKEENPDTNKKQFKTANCVLYVLVNDHYFLYTIQVHLRLGNESDHLHGLYRSQAMLDIRWYIEYITLLEILLLIIDFTGAPAPEDKKLMFPGMTMVRALPARFKGNDPHIKSGSAVLLRN